MDVGTLKKEVPGLLAMSDHFRNCAPGGAARQIWEFPIIRVPYSRGLILRILLFRVLY